MMRFNPFSARAAGNEVDFDYPQKVCADALKQLKKAQKSGDGQQMVDALVRFSIAKSSISGETMDTIVSQIEDVKAREKRPDYKALLNFLEALVFDGYAYSYGVADRESATNAALPADYSEWSERQLIQKMCELALASVDNIAELKKCPTSNYDKIFIEGDKLGYTYLPTLAQALCRNILEIYHVDDIREKIRDIWVESCDEGTPEWFFAQVKTDNIEDYEEAYNKYRDNEHSALFLDYLSAESHYDDYKDYVRRFPSSFYLPDVQNRIYEVERQSVSISGDDSQDSNTPVKVRVNMRNVNTAQVHVYRVPDVYVKQFEARQWSDIDLAKLKEVLSREVHAQGVVPFNQQVDLTLPALPYGKYFIACSFINGDGKEEIDTKINGSNIVSVHDMAMFTVGGEGIDDKLFVVDVNTGAPRKGVDVTVERSRGNVKSPVTGVTDANGSIKVPVSDQYRYYTATARLGDDKYGPSYRITPFDPGYKRSTTTARVFTDLNIYRPGETVKFVALLHSITTEVMAPLEGQEVEVTFKDSNYKKIESVKLTSDAYGRAEGQFVIPTDRMNGTFSISVESASDRGEKTLGSCSINVSEYKTPTYVFNFDTQPQTFALDKPVKITGRATSYSGVPVPNATVKLSLYKNEWTWWWRWYYASDRGEVINDTTITTNEKGEFEIEYPAELFPENDSTINAKLREFFNYSLKAQCTDQAGESHEATFSFIVGKRRSISVSDSDHNNVTPLKLKLEFNSTDEDEKQVECYYAVEDADKKVVLSGNFNSDNPVIDMTRLASGRYKVKVNILGDDKIQECDVTLYRKGEKVSPVADCPLWIPSGSSIVDDKNVAHITIGNSYDEANVYYLAASGDKVVKEGWVKLAKGMNEFTIAVPSTPGATLDIEFYSCAHHKIYSDSRTVKSNVKPRELKVKVNAFRDKLLSGSPEKWSFTFLNEQDKPMPGAMMLEMFDKAINDISDNTWSFHPSLYSKRVWAFSCQWLNGTFSDYQNWTHKIMQGNSHSLPEFNIYDESFFISRRMPHRMLGSAVMYMAKSAPMNDMGLEAESEMVMEEDAILESVEANGVKREAVGSVQLVKSNLDEVPLRMADVKVAMWQPMLTTDDNGNLTVEFDAPDFNTTWIVQGVAYNRELLADVLKREVVTNKPVMVKSSLPRFVRQGDITTLAGNLQNSTDEALQCDAVIELFNPRTGEILNSKTFAQSLAAQGATTLKIDWQVPDTIPFVGFRIKAASGNFSDGEQVMIPVLPAISPVIESEPFYIEAGAGEFTTRLPDFAADARVTLEYCDNPVWYCVQALPTIYSDNYNVATSLAHSLFAITLADGISKSQPLIKEAVDYWKSNPGDSSLVSMLARNADLKIGTLLASPWLREADRQTLRMSKLSELMDEQHVASEFQRIIKALERLQMSDGGFPWYRYPECRSSVYTTHEVLELIGELRHLGYLTDNEDINAIVKRAIGYYDKENLRLYKEQLKVNKKNHSGFSDYVYVRSLFPELALPAENKTMMKNCIKAMTTDWKGTSLGNKAFYALALNRSGEKKVARAIVESLRQFALVKPQTGMYWDNVQTGWRYFDKVAVTSVILEAMNEVDGRRDEIDQIRKWILLMKQTNDWGSSSLAAHAVYSLLTTGSQWLERNEMPQVAIDGKPVAFDKIDTFLGYCKKEIPATSLATLSIQRNGAGPAWGAVYSQFKASMDKIEEASVYDLSIHKEFYVYQTDGTLLKTDSFKVGDKVQVRTVIKNAKDLDFVTVKDERGACFEPVEQLSTYRYADYTCYYLEIKDSETNMFFTSLNKGTHVISNDVYVTAPGKYSVGIATAQCQYAPQVTAHSAGAVVEVE